MGLGHEDPLFEQRIPTLELELLGWLGRFRRAGHRRLALGDFARDGRAGPSARMVVPISARGTLWIQQEHPQNLDHRSPQDAGPQHGFGTTSDRWHPQTH